MQFTKSMAARLLIAALCVVATQIVVRQVKYRTGLQAAQGATFDVSNMPLQLGPWSGTVVEENDRAFAAVGGFSMSNRAYTATDGRRAVVHLANFSTADLLLPHPPNLCYSESGWTILDNNWDTDSHDRRYRLMRVEREGAAACVAYWYQVGPHVAASREDLRQIMLKLRVDGKPWPPLIKVLIQVSVDISEADALSTAGDLSSEIYNWIATNS